VEFALALALACSGCEHKPREYEIARVSNASLRVRAGVASGTGLWRPYVILSAGGREVDARCPQDALPPEGTSGLLLADPSGTRVAMRCSTQASWRVQYLLPGAVVEPCPGAQEWFGPSLDWSAVASVEDEALSMLACGASGWAPLAQSIESRGGQAALGRFARATALAPELGGVPGERAFLRSLARLSDADRAAVLATLVTASESTDARSVLRRRAEIALRAYGASAPRTTVVSGDASTMMERDS
jgi:hypothetical protein